MSDDDDDLFTARKDAPLTQVIKNGDVGMVAFLLQNGHKLTKDELVYVYTEHSTNMYQIIDLLDQHKAIPDGFSASTLKYLYALKYEDYPAYKHFKEGDNLNFRVSGVGSPLDLCLKKENADELNFLAGKDAARLGTYIVFSRMALSSYTKFYPEHVDICKERILTTLDKNQKNCELAETLIKRPSSQVLVELEGIKNPKQFVPFACWAAKNNKTDLLDNEIFQTILRKYPDVAKNSMETAALFESDEYIKKSIDIMGIDKVESYMNSVLKSEDKQMTSKISEVIQSKRSTLTSKAELVTAIEAGKLETVKEAKKEETPTAKKNIEEYRAMLTNMKAELKKLESTADDNIKPNIFPMK